MKIGILATGRVAAELVEKHGEYPDIFAKALSAADPALTFQSYDVLDGEFPDAPEACDGWLVTGSRHGAYDDLPWIARLRDFLRAAIKARRPVIGVCFGHQVLADALGGRTVKSDKGWGCGVHRYDVAMKPGWMADAPDQMHLHAMHQDQVVEKPKDATVIAASPFCEYAALAYGDPEAPYAISIQPHPEFSTEYARDLVERRREMLTAPVADAAVFGPPVHNEDWARWFAAYLRSAATQGAAA